MSVPSINPTIRHPDYAKYEPRWIAVDRICDGEDVQHYIHEIMPNDTSPANVARNRAFRERAVFAAVAGYTARGMNGMVFATWPKLNVPPQMEYVMQSIDGGGVSIYQQSQEAMKNVIRNSRCGLFIDYPSTENDTSIQDIGRGTAATCQLFTPRQILNWNTVRANGIEKLVLVILTERIRIERANFVFDTVDVVYELRLIDGFYVFREWRNNLGNDAQWQLFRESMPTDGQGNRWDTIPFVFIGAEKNTQDVESPALYDIVRLNIGHLNNSAIYEDSVFICGQPQPWISGIDFDWVSQSTEKGVYFGAPVMIPVPSGEQFGIAQAEPNTMAKEAMDSKVDQMIGLGAMFIQPGSAIKTATQSEGEQKAQHSVLSLMASNVSEAYTIALRLMARYMNASPDECEYTLNQDYVDTKADANMLREIIAGFVAGALPMADYQRWLQRNELAAEDQSLEDFAASLNTSSGPPINE